MPFGDEDLPVFFDDFGLRLDYGSNHTKGNFNEGQALEGDESGLQVTGTESVLEVSVLDFAKGCALYGLAVDDTIKVDGTECRVRDIRKALGDGRVKEIVVVTV